MNKDTRRGSLARRLRESVYPNRPEWDSLSHDAKIEWERMAEEFKRIAVESLSKEVEFAKKFDYIKFAYMTVGINQSIKTIKDL